MIKKYEISTALYSNNWGKSAENLILHKEKDTSDFWIPKAKMSWIMSIPKASLRRVKVTNILNHCFL